MNAWRGTGIAYQRPNRDQVELFVDSKILLQPLRWRKPRTIFWCSMTDAFAEFIPDCWIDIALAVAALSPQHTHIFLTKRAKRMHDYMCTPGRKQTIAATVMDISDLLAFEAGNYKARIKLDHFSACFAGAGPFPSVWLGVSIERQREADERVPLLLQTPAAKRLLSCEPLLGPVDLVTGGDVTEVGHIDWLRGFDGSDPPIPGIDLVIVGGESGGPKTRPMHPAWTRALRDQCLTAGVPFFFKQWGAWLPVAEWTASVHSPPVMAIDGTGEQVPDNVDPDDIGGQRFAWTGKKAAGATLDGREWREMPGG